jgi:hypothetical protein
MIDNRCPISSQVEFIDVETEVIDFAQQWFENHDRSMARPSSIKEEPISCGHILITSYTRELGRNATQELSELFLRISAISLSPQH